MAYRIKVTDPDLREALIQDNNAECCGMSSDDEASFPILRALANWGAS
jgi:hypothetical protein